MNPEYENYTVRYISTRGQAPALNFEDVVLTGLASDGGLDAPETMPQFSFDEIASWAGLPYTEIAYKVMHRFIGDEIPADTLKSMIEDTYGTFKHDAVTP